MVFSSIPFLFYFLPLVLLVYFIVPKKIRNLILFIFSLVFYAWGEPVYVVLMLFSTVVDFTHGMLIEKFMDSGQRKKAKGVLLSSIVINLGLLSFFKYSDFLIVNLNSILGMNIQPLNLPLPIGISFYTFQTMSYSIDVYRQEVKAQRNIISFGTYVALFPQLIAGPIVRFKTIADELIERNETVEKFSEGVSRFVTGLGKKVLLANNIGYLWDTIIAMDITQIPVLTAWLGILAFTFQIYFDFSGYSDMAIGLGKMFGFSFPENFNYPYISRSITEFWRRWHISLGTWFREYLYIPLGGNRKGFTRTIINIMVVWFATGFWHGAAWNFIIWGVYFGILLISEKLFLNKVLNKCPSFINHIYALWFIVLGWVIFAFDDTGKLFKYMGALFGRNGTGFLNNESVYLLMTNLIIFIILIIGCTPLPKMTVGIVMSKIRKQYVQGVIESLFLIIIFILSVSYIINSSYNPFLYFRF